MKRAKGSLRYGASVFGSIVFAALGVVEAQSSPTLLWDEDPASVVTGFAVIVDDVRTDYGLTPLGPDGACACSLTLPFSTGRHTLAVAAYNQLGEAVSPPLVVGPTAVAEGPYSGQAGSPITVSASRSSDSFFTITSYRWSWGDGNSDSVTTTPSATHLYLAPGTFSIAVTVSDDFPASDTATTTATIVAPPLPPPSTPDSPTPVTTQQNVLVQTTLSWSAGGASSFDVEFGSSSPPPLVATGLTSASYAPPAPLNPGTNYFWRIRATNESGTTAGPIWSFTTASPPPPEVVVYASDLNALHGSWMVASDPTSPAGTKLVTADVGFATTSAPLAEPASYVDVVFDAPANVPYTIWLRLQALDNSKYNDSVWAQFSDALVNGSPIYPLNSTTGLLINLPTDFSAQSLNGWGWQNTAYWLSQPTTVTFATNGSHILRLQVREDGVQVDQVVLSPAIYLSQAPGPPTLDSTIVGK